MRPFLDFLSLPGASLVSMRNSLFSILGLGTHMSTMVAGTAIDPANSIANGAALTADLIAAQGRQVVVLPGTYAYGGGAIGTAAVDLTALETPCVDLLFLPGAKLVCGTTGKNSTNAFFWFRDNLLATITGGDFDGNAIAEICARTSDNAVPGCELTVKDARIHNFGWNASDSATNGTLGTMGVMCSNSKRLVVENCQFANFRAKENGTYSDQPGKTVFIQWLNASNSGANPFSYNINNCEFDAGVEANGGDDWDSIHILQQWPSADARGVISNCRFKFHGKSRRVLKYQGGGIHKVAQCHMSPTPTWTPADTGATSVVITGASEATPGVFTTAAAHAIQTGTPVLLSDMAGSASWAAINAVEYLVVPVSATAFNLFGPGAPLDTTGLGTFTFGGVNPGSVRRTNGQGQAMVIHTAVAATGVFATRYGIVSAPHGFVTGEMVRMANLAGGSWPTLNDLDFFVEVVSPTEFTLRLPSLLNTTGFGTYTASSGSLTRINGVSNEGMNGIDWAGGNDGLLEVENCHLNLSGFRNGIVQSIGVGGTIHVRNSVIVGNRYDANRYVPDSAGGIVPEIGQPIAWSTGGLDEESSLVNCDIYGWARGCLPAGMSNKIVGNRFIDPRMLWLQTATAAKDGLVVTDNEVITRTPYSLNSSADGVTADFARCGEIRNWTNVKVNRNRLVRRGNVNHGTRFIAFNVNGVTGEALDNTAPALCLPISYSSGVAPLNNPVSTAVAGAATSNTMRGRVTTEALTTAAGDTPYTLTITNDRIVIGDTVWAKVANGTNTAGVPILGRVTEAAGSVAIQIYNRHTTAAFNGTLIVSYKVEKA